MKFFFDDCDEHIGGDGAPDLRLHRVLAGIPEFLDLQILLAPLEEQFALPAILVKLLEHIGIAPLALADVNEAGNGPTQIEQRVQLDRSLGRAKRRPIEQPQTQVDGARSQGIGIDIACDVHIELIGTTDQDRGEVDSDTPVAPLVGSGQHGAAHCLMQSHRVELGSVGTPCAFDVAQGLAPSELRGGQNAFGAGQCRDPCIACVARHAACKAGPSYERHQLGGNVLPRFMSDSQSYQPKEAPQI